MGVIILQLVDFNNNYRFCLGNLLLYINRLITLRNRTIPNRINYTLQLENGRIRNYKQSTYKESNQSLQLSGNLDLMITVWLISRIMLGQFLGFCAFQFYRPCPTIPFIFLMSFIIALHIARLSLPQQYIQNYRQMEPHLMQIYLFCTVMTTVAFFYLIFNFFMPDYKKCSLADLSFSEIDNLNQNIEGLMTALQLSEQKQGQGKPSQSSVSVSRANKIMSSRKRRYCCQIKNRRQYNFLPSAALGLSEMKNINKNYIKNMANAGAQVLLNQKKRKNITKFVKKYSFHKTTLVTIYEELQY